MFINIKLFIISFLNKVFLLRLNSGYSFSIHWILLSANVLNGQISCDLCERTMRRAIRQPTGRGKFTNRNIEYNKYIYIIMKT